ncbi:MAG: thioredoxin [Candidatus Aenigmatarchaeota archaeon]
MNELKNLEEFENILKISEKYAILIDFYADWCMPCKYIAPILEKIEEKYKDKIKVLKINVENFPEISMEFGIVSVPTIVIIKNGEEIDRFVGAASETKIIEWLRENNII